MLVDRLQMLSHAVRRNRGQGFTFLELLMTVAVVSLLAAVAVPSYSRVLERQKVQQSARDLMNIAAQVERYRTTHFAMPDSLSDLGFAIPKDPWGRDYQFLNFKSTAPGTIGKIRKDHNLHPLNSEFDLYSIGKDGSSAAALTAQPSKDDVIWARDGNFVGLAADY